MALTNKQRAFVEEYLHDFNATQAAIRAKYSERTAYQQGYRLLKNVEVAEVISQRLQETAMSADEVLMRLANQARGDMADFLDFRDVGMLPFLNLRKAAEAGKLQIVKKLKYNAEGYPEVELYDAQSALVQLGKVHGLFTDKVEHVGEVNINVKYGDTRTDGDVA